MRRAYRRGADVTPRLFAAAITLLGLVSLHKPTELPQQPSTRFSRFKQEHYQQCSLEIVKYSSLFAVFEGGRRHFQRTGGRFLTIEPGRVLASRRQRVCNYYLGHMDVQPLVGEDSAPAQWPPGLSLFI